MALHSRYKLIPPLCIRALDDHRRSNGISPLELLSVTPIPVLVQFHFGVTDAGISVDGDIPFHSVPSLLFFVVVTERCLALIVSRWLTLNRAFKVRLTECDQFGAE